MKPYFLLSLLAASTLAAIEVGPIKIQRRNAIEHATGVRNAEGELTYSVNDAGNGVLTVGAHEGNIIVSDPCAIRLAPQRILASSEWAPTLGQDVMADTSGAITFFDAYKVPDTARTLVIEAADPLLRISRVTYDQDAYMVTLRKSISGNVCTLTATSDYDAFMDPLDNGAWATISNIVVYAWSGQGEGEASVDFMLNDLSITDSIGEIEMSRLRQWVMTRYDHNTGALWSRYPATDRVLLSGHPIFFDVFGGVRAGMSGGATNRWQLIANGSTVMELTPGVTEFSDQLSIVGFDPGSPSQLVFQVSSAFESPVSLQTAATLDGEWTDVEAGLTSSFPATTTVDYNGVPVSAYTLTLTVDPETTGGFFRAKTTLPSYGATTLEIKNCTLIYDGHPMGIVTQVVEGVTYEVLGRVLP